jgi:hypothetical protein
MAPSAPFMAPGYAAQGAGTPLGRADGAAAPLEPLASAQIGDSRVQNVCCRHRLRHSSGGHFPGHCTKTAFELPIRRASAKRCGLRLVILAGLVWAER